MKNQGEGAQAPKLTFEEFVKQNKSGFKAAHLFEKIADTRSPETPQIEPKYLYPML